MALTFFQSFLAAVLLLSLHLQSVDSTTTSVRYIPRRNRGALQERALAISDNIPQGWVSKGCYTDSVASRALYSATYVSTSMTQESCIDFCGKRGYSYAGVEYSQECFCGRGLAVNSVAAAAEDCNMACSGEDTERCGGGNRLNVFHNEKAADPATNAGPPGWGFIGCYTDSVAARTLPVSGPSAGGAGALTVALCAEACENLGYILSGVEYSGECYCGNTTLNDGVPAPDGLVGCNMLCNGNSTEYCGGPNRLDMYGFGQKSIIEPKWSSLGCYTDSVQKRALATGMAVLGGAANMTIEGCQDACHAAKFTLAGLEYASECYCDNSFKNGNGPAPDGDAQCNMACNGNLGELCGGPNRLNMYSYVGGPTATSVTSSTSTTSTIATSTSSGTAAQLPSVWKYSGCYIDNAYGRILVQQPDSTDLTVESCVQTCRDQEYTISGMEYSTQCFCGNYIINGGTLADDDTDCAMNCGGNSGEICGGPNRMSIYANGTIKAYSAPVVQNSSLPGSWKYEGCLTDAAQVRALPYQITSLATNLTATNCLSLCSDYGYSAGGLEYGSQCFCGDDSDRISAGATFRAEGDCSFPCTGDPTSLCGGANALSYYTSANINTWKVAAGTDAGQYQFLIGGVVIPLITTMGVNGKVTFVEKHGTGPLNSTGAYELDLSQINNFDAAWRSMTGLKTDVFCSAGLTLPDKVGRQLNIGGWSTDSLYGIRLYWPDGSPGVPGINDWQENVGEVALQTGRWYPTAMQMTNGSILVVGGENGSNGAPQPNLEVVPKPAGGDLVYCDWLDRTDPNNLYPFLAVLPSGGIFVAYYNEARILDEQTFDTVRTLPTIPGAVNNPLAGRTYPLEGTAMILPQSAPYTDPLTVIICGGSTPYQGFALDNCVSIQPEVPGSNWTIERMPSKRVISCMTALPDGTFLIMNGAMQGMAGFGLASQPNHNAVLYDPTKPVNSRFTVMANTTIDRLYHSEALLLQDGRVLVSGSDPEGAPYAQEYRVEVFIPPYLMNNATQPTFSLNNKTDWAYGEDVLISITSGSAAKVSLMGAVSSTHGNSMGQRTYFPAFSCRGTLCTITAPPSAHVCPMGWFMLFVLDNNGVPSVAQWVRIGGDPAGLGNWPNFPDFSLPGV